MLWDFTYTNALMIKARMPGQVLTAEMGVLEVESVLFLGRRREEGIEQVKFCSLSNFSGYLEGLF